MRTAAVLLATMLLVLSASPAGAQTEPVWTDPSGRFSLAFSALGWTELAPAADEPGLLLAIEHRRFQEDGRMRTCLLTERRQTVAADGRLTQASLNAVTTSLAPGGLARTIGRSPTRSEVITVDGVAVVDAVFEGETRQHMRVFFMKDHADIVQIILTCGATSPVEPEVDANIAQLLQTLHIVPE